MVVLKVENNTTTEWPEPRATNCSEFTQTIGMAASPFLVLVSLLRSRQRLSLLALAHVKVLLLACSRQGSHGQCLLFFYPWSPYKTLRTKYETVLVLTGNPYRKTVAVD